MLKLTGSLFDRDAEDIRAVAKVLADVLKELCGLTVVTGGGKAARHYIDIATRLGADQATLDEIGTEASRINAKLLIITLGSLAYPYPPDTLEEAVKAVSTGKVVVAGGFQPGQSTNAVASLLAERLSASLFINATDVEGVYDKDPKRFRDAKLLKKVSVAELRRILEGSSTYAGTYELMDPLALKIIERSKIPTRIIKCSPECIRGALVGRDIGTLIVG
ncbi:MAG: UMP kinase [Nitrososphaerales archaeon]